MKRLLILLIIFFVATSHIFSQSKSKRLAKADKAFDLEEYYKAAELYKKAYEKTKNRAVKAEIIFKQAECYRLSGNTKRAENYYKRAIKTKFPNTIVFLRYADVLRMNQDYDEALLQYQKYLELNPNDIDGEKGLKSCEFALKWLSTPTRYKLELMPLVNSRFSDFSPAFGNSDYTEMYFTSARSGGITDKLDDRTGEAFTDIYVTRLDKKGKWSIPVLAGDPINTEGNEGSVALNDRGTSMYLTLCKVEKKKSLGCGIYISKRKGRLWENPQELQIKLDSNTSIGHPTLSSDEKILIFSSDLSNGYGGKDLWLVKREKRNRWSEPINLGPAVNTTGDEMFPFLHPDGTLYFSSDGHIGVGGLDIYKSSPDANGAYSSVVNLKCPVNSSGDDFGMVIESNGERGYLTSNRSGGKGGDDIYQFELPPLKLFIKGVVTDSKTGAIITNANIELIGSDGSTTKKNTDNTGSYEFQLKPLTSYEVIVAKEEYLKKKITETTYGLEFDKTFTADFSIDPIKKEIVLPRIEYDFAKSELRQKSIEDLNLLVITLNDNPNIVIELQSHTDYVGSDKQNMKLSQDRANVCISYLVNQGVNSERLIALGKGETVPFVIDKDDGKFKQGDVLTERYIKKLRRKKHQEKANQYNRRTSFKVISENYVSSDEAPVETDDDIKKQEDGKSENLINDDNKETKEAPEDNNVQEGPEK
ncbi:MAG: OmpA family protein [Bacteroidota bacterium]|nr:OmpA family protein [Bacteroidota bacterium]